VLREGTIRINTVFIRAAFTRLKSINPTTIGWGLRRREAENERESQVVHQRMTIEVPGEKENKQAGKGGRKIGHGYY